MDKGHKAGLDIMAENCFIFFLDCRIIRKDFAFQSEWQVNISRVHAANMKIELRGKGKVYKVFN